MSSIAMGRIGESLSRQLRPLHLSSIFTKHLPLCKASSGRVPLTFFEPTSLKGCSDNEPSGTMVVVKEGTTVHGVGFYDPSELCVEVFHWQAPSDASFPVTDVRFFHGLIMAAIKRRAPHFAEHQRRQREALMAPDTIVRLFHGAADGIPSLYISLIGTRAQIVATSTSAEQLIPLVELLLAKVFEVTDCYVYSPSEVLHVVDSGGRKAIAAAAAKRAATEEAGGGSLSDDDLSAALDTSSSATTIATSFNSFVENGVSYPAPSQGMLPSIKGVGQLLSLTTYPVFPIHHAASRAVLPQDVKGKTVLLMGLEEGVLGMLLNVLGAADRVIVATDSHVLKPFLHERVTRHFSEAAFAQIQFMKRADIRPEVFGSELGINYVGICGMSVGSSLIASRVERRGATQLIDMIEHTLECMLAGQKGAFKGSLVVQCGGNALGVHRPSRGGLVKGPMSFLKVAVDEALRGTHAKYQDEPRISLVQRRSFTRTPQFPHHITLLDEADKVGMERWEPVYCDAIFDVVLEECAVSHAEALVEKRAVIRA